MKLDQQQVAAASDISEGIKLIIAGAGGGKTTTLIALIAAHKAARVNMARAVCITFTVNAATVLKTRLQAQGIELGFIGTLQSYCLHLLNRYGLVYGFRPPLTVIDEETERTMIEGEIVALRAKNLNVAEVRKMKARQTLSPAGTVAKSYLSQLRLANCSDFETLIIWAKEIVPSVEISALYVDEFQDSSPLDVEFYDAVNAPRKAIIGDADQSVYSFRGGAIAGILNLAKRPGVKVYELSTNYRSGYGIVQAANRLIAHNSERIENTMKAATDEKGNAAIWKSDSAFIEAARIAEYASKLKALRPLETLAVLVRYNHQIGPIADALTLAGVTVDRETQKDEWRNVAISALNVIKHRRDVTAPAARIAGALWLKRHGDSAETLSEALEGIGRRCGREWREMPSNELVHAMRLPNEAINAVREAWTPERTVDGVIEALEITGAKNAAAVTVGTMHGAKGDEFDGVIIAGLCAEVMPGGKTGPKKEEERRLFYVAMTRARRTLIFSEIASYVPKFGTPILAAQRSQFINELYEDKAPTP